MLGITGVSSDMRDIRAAAESGNPRAELAIEMFAARIKKFVGAYAALMEGIDMIVFTGGIGENDPGTRERVSKGLEFMGVKFDPEVNRGSARKRRRALCAGFARQGRYDRYERRVGHRFGYVPVDQKRSE